MITAESPHRSAQSRLAAWVYVALLGVILAEMAARVVFPLPAVRNFDRARYSPPMVSGPLLSRATLAHASYLVESAPDQAASVHKLNLHGFRDREWSPRKQTAKRVLVVGDSIVEGFLTPQEATIPQVLQRLSQATQLDTEFLNLGVGGAGLSHYASLTQDAVVALAPDEVILVLYANDLLGNPTFTQELVHPRSNVTTRPWWTPRLADAAVALLDKEALPRRWHQAPFAFFPAVPDPANPWTTRKTDEAAFVDKAVGQAMQEGRFNPFNVGEVQEYEKYLLQPVDIQPWLAFFQKFLSAYGIGLRVVYVPQAAQVSDHYMPFKQKFCPPGVPSLQGASYQQGAATVARHAKALEIPFLDLTPMIRSREAAGDHLYWDHDEHMRPGGYTFVAQAIHEWRQRQLQRSP